MAPTLFQPLIMTSRNPAPEVAEAITQMGEMVVDLRRRAARAVEPNEIQRIGKLIRTIIELQLSTLPRALREWEAHPSDDAEVWGWLGDWECARAIMSPLPCPPRRRPRQR